jgi:3',5'-cyclic-AMP phosphodiesterase
MTGSTGFAPKRLNNLTKSSIQLVQLTDTHLFGDPGRLLRGTPTLPALRATIAAAHADLTACDAVLATGDLVQDDAGGYARFREEFGAIGKPVLCIPGNHDDLPSMHLALAHPPFQLGGVYDAGNWRTILLDSTVAGETGGALRNDELDLLQAALFAAPARHTLVALHHHPIPLRSRWLDTVGLTNADALFKIVRAHSQVRGIVFGHVHQAVDVVHEGVRLLGTPSTCSQFKPGSEDFALDDLPPAWRTLRLDNDGRLDTRLHWVDPAAVASAARLKAG